MTKEIGGYFCYVRHNGRLSVEKYHVWGDTVHKDTAEYYNQFKIYKVPLTVEEFDNDDLDTLTARYPLPERLKQATS